jgi:predicted DNA-binding transcriptional regulator AlpA
VEAAVEQEKSGDVGGGRELDSFGRFMKVREVAASVGLSRAMIYRLMHDEADPFPAPVKVGAASLWVEQEVVAWKARRVGARPGAEGGDIRER